MNRFALVHILIVCFLSTTALAGPKKKKKTSPPTPKPIHYIKHVKPMDQLKIKSPRRKDGMKVYEGCGPISAAMLLGYWQTERGQKKLLSKGFKGKKHPKKAIRKLYKEMKSKKAPGKKQRMSYTMPDGLFKALKKRAKKGRKIKANRMRKIRKWKKRQATLKKQLRKGNPVILLKNKEHKDGCLGESSKGRNLVKNLSNAHYFVAVGYQGNKVAIMPGWKEKDKSTSKGFKVHKRGNRAHGICTFGELKKANVSLFWIEKD